MDAKSIFKSKTFWANFFAVVLILAQQVFGIAPADLPPETQAIIVAIVNIILRLITKKPVYIK